MIFGLELVMGNCMSLNYVRLHQTPKGHFPGLAGQLAMTINLIYKKIQ